MPYGHGFCLAVATVLAFATPAAQSAAAHPVISVNDSTTDLVAAINTQVNLTCVVLRTATALWYFTDQHLSVLNYLGDSQPPVLLSADHAYSLAGPLRPATVAGALADLYWELTLSVKVTGQTYGHYQCLASNGTNVVLVSPDVQQIHDVYVRLDGSTKPAANRTVFSSCCLNSGIAENCKLFCQPWNLTLASDVLIKMVSCTSELNTKVAACGLGSSNVGRCCARREVPTPCLAMCRQSPGSSSAATDSVCYNATVLADIFTCHAEGVVSVPGPPINVGASLDRSARKILVKWAEPAANPHLVKGYSVHWKADTDSYFYSNVSSSILVGATVSLSPTGPALAPQYSVYVQSIGEHGTSTPSPTVTTVEPVIVPNVTLMPVKQCCLDKKLSVECADRLCSGKPILNLTVIIGSSCGKHMADVFSCYAGGRNHTDCCQTEGVPTACVKFCTGEPPHVTVDDTAACLPHLDAMARCYDAGAASIPSQPRSLSLDTITDRSVSVRWLPPQYNAKLVRNYTVLVVDKVTGWRTWTTVIGGATAYTVYGLASDRFYELAVSAVGDFGSSLLSNRMTVMTMDKPPGSQAPGTNSGQPDFSLCCSQLGVPSNCTSHCSASFNPDAMSPYCRAAALPALLACLTDGRNNTRCCQGNGVPASCLAACQARPGESAPPAHCLTALPAVKTCASAAYGTVPSEPTHLAVQSYGTTFVDLSWQLPARRPTGALFRYVLHANVELSGAVTAESALANFPADVTSGHVVNLKPGAKYDFRLAAVSDAGSSLLSDPVSVWLLPDLPYNWTAASSNVSHLPYGITNCCKARKVPPHCQLLCDPRNMINWNHTDSSLSEVYTNCTPSLPDISSCLADGKNHEVCCRRETVPDVCLGLCSGSPVPGGSLICPLWWREIYGCIEEGILGVPPQPIIRRVDVFSSRLSVTFDRATLDAAVRSILYIRYADSPSHWYAFLNPANPAHFRVPANTSFALFMLNSNSNGSSQPSQVYTVRTQPEQPLNMFIISSAGSFRLPESAQPLTLTCYFTWDAAGPMPKPTHSWYRSGHLLQSGASPSYSVPHAESRDSGLYTCVVRLSNGQAGSVSVPLHIQSAPVATAVTGLVPAVVGPGETARLTCAFEGFPDSVDWRDPAGVAVVSSRDGSVRVPQPTIEDLHTYSTVEFSGITAGHFGHYTCTGANSFGSHTAGLKLYNSADASGTTPAPPTVQPPPTPPSPGGGGNATAPSVVCCAKRGVAAGCLAICAPVPTAAPTADCAADFRDHAVHCLASSRNFTRCCLAAAPRGGFPAGCLPLCWGDPPAAGAVCDLTATGVMATVATCLRKPDVPERPRLVTAAPTPPNGLRVTWHPPASGADHVTGYRVVMLVAGSAQPQVRSTGPGETAVVFAPVPASVSVTVTVTSLGSSSGPGDSLPSQTASAATGGPPKTPTDLHVISSQNNIAVVGWVLVPGSAKPDGFQVNATLGDLSISLQVKPGQNRATLRCLAPRSAYEIRVRAFSIAWGASAFTKPPLLLTTGAEDPTCRGTNYDYWRHAAFGGYGTSGAGTAVVVTLALLACLALAFAGLVFYWRRTGVPSSVRSHLPCMVDIVDGDCCRCCDANRMAGYVANGGGGGGGRGAGASDQLFDNPVRFDSSDGVVRFGDGSGGGGRSATTGFGSEA